MKIAIPVVITLLLDVFLTRLKEQSFPNTTIDRTITVFTRTSSSSSGISTKWAIILAVILVAGIFLVTIVLLLLYYYGCTKCIIVWMVIAVTLLLSYYVYLAVGEIPSLENWPIDWITVVFFLLNVVIVGNMAVFWRAPKIVTQIILILISVMTCCVFLFLPDWTVWLLLGMLVIYDICVVLCPRGPLQLLIKKSQERGDAIPALIYSSAAYTWKDGPEEEEESHEIQIDRSTEQEENNQSNEPSTHESNEQTNQETNEQEDKKPLEKDPENGHHKKHKKRRPKKFPLGSKKIHPAEPKELNSEQSTESSSSSSSSSSSEDDSEALELESKEGIKLGLGDFVFYGILISRAARKGWDTSVVCIEAVLLGLSITLIFLAILERPLPALPFSLVLGIIFYFIMPYTLKPFALNLRKLLLVY